MRNAHAKCSAVSTHPSTRLRADKEKAKKQIYRLCTANIYHGKVSIEKILSGSNP